MGVRIDGSNDVVSAVDGTLTVDGLSLNVAGIITASGGFKVGSAVTISSNGNATFSGITTFGNSVHTGIGVSVGIGTDIPEHALVVRDTGLARLRIRNDTASSENYASLNLKTAGFDNGWSVYSEYKSSDADNYLKIFKGDGTATHMYFQDPNEVGIRSAFYHVDANGADQGDSCFGFIANTANPGFKIKSGGTERLRVTSAGLVGINSTSPATALDIQSTKNSDGLTITKAGTRSAFLGHNGSGNEGLLTLKEGGTTKIQLIGETGQNSYINSGNLGIGTDNPSRLLELAQSNSTAYSTTDFDKDYHVLKLRNYTNDKSVGMQFLIGGNGEAAITAHEEDGDGSTTLAFGVRNSGSRAERMRIDSGGHLLHGVTADEDTSGNGGVRFINAGDIQIDGDQQALLFRSTNNTAQEQSAIEWWNENGAGIQAKILCDRTAVSQAPGDLVFYTSANVDSSANSGDGDITERLRITSGGQVRIGSSGAPSNKNTVTPLAHVDGSGVSGGFQVNRHTSVGGGGSQLMLTATRGSSITSHTVLQSGDGIGTVEFAGSDGGEFVSAATIQAQVDGDPGNDDMPGRLIFKTTEDGESGSTERMRINKTGQVLIGADFTTATASTSVQFRVRNGLGGHLAEFNRTDNVDGNNRDLISFRRGSAGSVGSITASNSATQYNTSSDYRLKENVTLISDGITRVKQLAPKRFNFIIEPGKTVDGFLAHEAATVVPEAVSGTHNEVDDDNNPVYQGIDQSKLVPLLTAALQEAITKIETLETKVAALEGG